MVDERVYADDVRAWFEAVPAPPARLDVERTVATGRFRARRRRRVRIGAGAAVMSACLLAAVPAVASVWPRGADRGTGGGTQGPAAVVSSAPSAPAACTPTALTPPPGLAERGVKDPTSVKVSAMDPTGRFVVGDTYGGFNASPAVVLWDNGVGRVLPTPGDHAVAMAVNASGVVTGLGAEGNGLFYGWVYRDGTVRKLPLPAGYDELFEPAGINVAGDIVGNVNDAKHTRSALVVWPAANPDRPQILKALKGEDAIAAGIRDDGTVVAWVPGRRAVYRWKPGGAGTALPLPDGATGGWADSVRGRWALGGVRTTDVPTEAGAAARWNLDTGTVEVISIPPEHAGQAGPRNKRGVTATNNAGDLVVDSSPAGVLRAGRWQSLSVTTGGKAEARPVAISEDGSTVAGWVHVDPTANIYTARPTVWRC